MKVCWTRPRKRWKFKLTKFVVSAEICANGKLVLVGGGVEAAATGAF